jgi:hypothetical protein
MRDVIYRAWRRVIALSKDAQPVAETVGVLIAVIALVFLVAQVRMQGKQQRTADASLGAQYDALSEDIATSGDQVLTSHLLELDRAMLDLPALRSCFVVEMGLHDPCPAIDDHADPQLVAQANALAILHLDLFDQVYNKAEFLFGVEPPERLEETTDGVTSWGSWMNFMLHTFRASQLTCRVLFEDHPGEYTAGFMAAVREASVCPTG